MTAASAQTRPPCRWTIRWTIAETGLGPLLIAATDKGLCRVAFDEDQFALARRFPAAEIVAGGSIHIYGTLRGRAMAGVNGNSSARIYCQKIEAELLAIDGYYQTAEEIDVSLRNRPAQAWLEGDTMKITPLN